ncbi:MAG: transglutaminaseTgpA domain-containing protein [Colwellia sp.]
MSFFTPEFNKEMDLNRILLFLIPSHLITLGYQFVDHVWWVPLFYGICLFCRFAYEKKVMRFNWKIFRVFLIVLTLGLVFIISKTHGFLPALFSLLALTLGLKVFELSRSYDLVSLACIQLFLIGSSLLNHFEIYHALLLSLSLLLTLASLMQFEQKAMSGLSISKETLKLAAYSIPIALILFFILPKLPPLWKMPKQETKQVGLSEEISPGDIAELAQSSRSAFRATFAEAKPRMSELYWRVLIQDEYDGKRWTISEQARASLAQAKKYNLQNKDLIQRSLTSSPRYNYTVIAEPSYQSWLFALQNSLSDEPKINHLANGLLVSESQVNTSMQYSAVSYSKEPVTGLKEYSPLRQVLQQNILKQNLKLPSGINPRARQWIAEFQQKFDDQEQLISAVLAEFSQHNFSYTLKPLPLSGDQIDSFLFDTQSGFCSYYASAFAFLMRSAGIPARIVSGYLGGELNPSGEYYSIYQYDAHAWVEVHHPTKGWQSYDPTAFVAPERVESSLQNTLASQNEYINYDSFSLIKYKDNWLANELRLAMSNIDYQWSRWVVNYNSDLQKQLFRELFGKLQGWGFYLRLTLFFVVCIGLVFAVMWFVQSDRNKQNQVQRLYQKALKKLNAKGVIKKDGQTPENLLKEVRLKAPELTAKWREIVDLINYIQYSTHNKSRKKQYRLLKKKINQLG